MRLFKKAAIAAAAVMALTSAAVADEIQESNFAPLADQAQKLCDVYKSDAAFRKSFGVLSANWLTKAQTDLDSMRNGLNPYEITLSAAQTKADVQASAAIALLEKQLAAIMAAGYMDKVCK